jgi:hypothetical protein
VITSTSETQFRLFDLPDDAGATPVCWSYGMGADSTAALYRTLVDPACRPPELLPDLSNLIVMIAQTGDEWSDTIRLVEQHMLPAFRRFRVRVVEVARAGPAEADGIVILQDTRRPVRLHANPVEHGFFALSEEHRRNGVMPQLGGRRLCSAKAKGFPLDTWRKLALGHRRYVHAVGFNRDEGARISGDASVTMGGRREPIYPVHEWNWSRQDCIDYLWRVFGVVWPKSLCRQCCFAGSRTGWPAQLARYQAYPVEAAPHVVDEFVTVALNKESGLFGPNDTLSGRLERDHAGEVLRLARRRAQGMTWALYRVRRLFWAPAQAWRSVHQLRQGEPSTVRATLRELAEALGLSLRADAGLPRLWLAERTPDVYPALEEFLVAAPAQAVDKQRRGFEARWRGHADEQLIAREDTVADRLAA